MPEVIAIDWEADRLCGVLAETGRDHVQIRRSFVLPVPVPEQESAVKMGAWLKDELRKLGATARQVVVSVPREDVVTRHLELPPCTDDELPTLVRFQSAARSTVSVEQLAIDFLPLPQRDAVEGREVLALTLQDDRIRRLRTVAEGAGLELLSISVSSVATAALVLDALGEERPQPGDLVLIVARHGDRLEISVLERGQLLMSHSSQVSLGETEQSRTAVLSEVSRSLIALQKRMAEARVAQCWLIGSETEESELGLAIRDRFRCPVQRLDPFKAPHVVLESKPVDDPHSTFGGPIGMLLTQVRPSTSTVDFLNPRRPAQKKDYSRHKQIAAAVAAIVLIGGMFGYRAIRVSAVAKEADLAKKSYDDQQNLLKMMEPQVKVAQTLGDWAQGRANWLEETEQLAKTMQGTDRLYLTRLSYGEGTRDERGTVSATGLAKERSDVELLNAALSGRPDTEVNAKPIKKSTRDSQYPQQFDLDVHLKRIKPEPAAGKSTRAAAAPAGTAR